MCGCVGECEWVWVCGTESSSHHNHCIHTLPISVNSVFTHYAIVKLSSVVVSITYLHTQSGESSYLPFTMADIRQSDLPPCIIHISGTCKEVIKHTIHMYLLCPYLSLVCVLMHTV